MARSVVLGWHGFLGQAQDWRDLPWSAAVAVEALDLWQSFASLRPTSLADWGRRIELPDKPVWAVGYSFGGRLLLHALQARPEHFHGVVFVSTHPGFSLDSPDRPARLASDRHWQSLLRELSWTELMQRWQAQPVLQTSQPLAPHENAFNREILAAVMEVGSLAHQEDFRSTLARPLRPILWITGARDHKFVALAKGLTTDHLQTETFKDAGHRVPWDQPLQFTQRVEKFVLDQQLL